MAALALAPGRDVKVLASLPLARVGDTARAKAMVEGLEKSDPLNTVLKLYWLPTIKAAIELNEGNSAQALVLSGSRRSLRIRRLATGARRNPVSGLPAWPGLPGSSQRQRGSGGVPEVA